MPVSCVSDGLGLLSVPDEMLDLRQVPRMLGAGSSGLLDLGT